MRFYSIFLYKLILSFTIIMTPLFTFSQEGADPLSDSADSTKTEQVTEAGVNAEQGRNTNSSGGNVDLGSFEVCTTGIFKSSESPISLITTCPAYAYAKISIFLLNASSDLFDFVLPVALEVSYLKSGSEGKPTQLEIIWSQVRDIANAFFIIGIIWIAGMMVLGTGNYRQPLIRLIIIAFVINFSLLVTRIVVDVGNVTALLLYNSIEVENASTKELPNIVGGKDGGTTDFSTENLDSSEVKSITGAFLAVLNPGVFFGADTLDVVTQKPGEVDTNEPYLRMMILLGTLGTVSIFVAWNFFRMALAFLTRSILLILYAVISPLAFASYFIPGQQNLLKKWFVNLVQVSFCITVYMFAIYLIFVLIIGASGADALFDFGTDGKGAVNNFSNNTGAERTFAEIMITIAIQYTIVIVLLSLGYKYAKQFCDKVNVGDMALSLTQKVAGLGLGVAAGVTGATVGRGVIGRLAYKRSNDQDLLAKATEGGIGGAWARTKLYAFDNIQNSKFGTSGSYKQKVDTVADREENFRKRSLNAKAEDLVSQARAAGNTSFSRADGLKQAKAQEVERIREKGGPKSGIVGTLLGSITEGTGEAERRFLQKEGQDAQQKKNNEIQKRLNEKITENKTKSVREADKQTKRVRKDISDGVRAAGGIDKVDNAQDLINSETINNMTKSVSDGGAGMSEATVQGMMEEVDDVLKYRKDAVVGLNKQMNTEKENLSQISEVKEALESGTSIQELTRESFAAMSDEDLSELGLEFNEEGDVNLNAMGNVNKDDILQKVQEKEALIKEKMDTVAENIKKESVGLNKEVEDIMKNTMREHREIQNDKAKSASDRIKVAVDNATEELQKAQEFGGDVADLDINLEGALNLDDELSALKDEVDRDLANEELERGAVHDIKTKEQMTDSEKSKYKKDIGDNS